MRLARDGLLRQHVARQAAAVEEPGELRGSHPARGPHRLGVGAKRARRAGRPRPGQAAEHREHVSDEDAARRRGRVGRDHVASERHLERPPPDRPVGGQVGHRKRASRRVLVIDHRPRQLARVEVIRELGQPLDRRREVRLANRLAVGNEPSSGPEDRTDLGGELEDPADCDEHRVLPARARHAARGRLGRGHQEVVPGHRPKPAVHGAKSREDAGHRARRRADVELLRRLLVEGHEHPLDLAEPAVSGHLLPRDRREGVEDMDAPGPRGPHHQEASAARARQPGLGGPRHRAGGDRRVDRVPAALEHARRGAGGDCVAGCDRSSHDEILGPLS